MEINEELLEAVKQVQKGKEEGFNKLYSFTYNYVYFRAKSIMKNDHEAWDILQEVYIVAFKSLSRLKNPEKIYTWLGSVAYYLSMKAYRKKNDVLLNEESEKIFENLESSDRDIQPEQSIDDKETCNIIKELIDQLPSLQKSAVIAYYFDQMSVKDIAMIFGCSEGTIKSRLNYARQFLRQAVEVKEKKSGVKLRSITTPTILLAFQLLSEDTKVYAKESQMAYNEICDNLNLKASQIQIGENEYHSNKQLEQIQQSGEVIRAKSLVVKFTSVSIKTKLLIVGAIAVVGTSSVFGYVSLITKNDNKSVLVTQTNDKLYKDEDNKIISSTESDYNNTPIDSALSNESEIIENNVMEGDTSDLLISQDLKIPEQQANQDNKLETNKSTELIADLNNQNVNSEAETYPASSDNELALVDNNSNEEQVYDTDPVTPEPVLDPATPDPVTPEPVSDPATPDPITPEPVSDPATPDPVTPEPVSVAVIPDSITPEPVSTTTTPVPTHTHTYSSVETITAGCTSSGIRTYNCMDGDDSYTEVIPSWHDAGGIWYEQIATTTRIGAKVRACPICGTIFESMTSPALTTVPTP